MNAAGSAEEGSLETSAGPKNPRKPGTDSAARLSDLLAAVEGASRVLVLTHDNPDPDAIASAAGLGFLIERTCSVPVDLAFGGIIGRAENRALMEELGVPFQRAEGLALDSGTVVALVDTQPRAGNNSLPEGRIASVVVDHHPRRPETDAAPFADVRPEYGACASLVVEYLRVARIEPDRRLATALWFGIQSETMDLGREVCEADVDASLFLYPRSDPVSISRIRHARVPRALYRSIHEGLERAWSRGGVVCVPMGRMEYPDLVAQLADLFLRVDGVEWVIAGGRFGESLLLSLRTHNPQAHAGELVLSVVGDRGSAGGHGEMAGARIKLGTVPEDEYDVTLVSLLDEFCSVLGVGDHDRVPLIRSGSETASPEGETGKARPEAEG